MSYRPPIANQTAPPWTVGHKPLSDRQALAEMMRVTDTILYGNVFLLVNEPKRLRKIQAAIRRMQKEASQHRHQTLQAKRKAKAKYDYELSVTEDPELLKKRHRQMDRIRLANAKHDIARGAVFPLVTEGPNAEPWPPQTDDATESVPAND